MGPQRTFEQVPQVVLVWPQAWAQVSSSIFDLTIQGILGILLKFTSGSGGLGRILRVCISTELLGSDAQELILSPTCRQGQSTRQGNGLGP